MEAAARFFFPLFRPRWPWRTSTWSPACERVWRASGAWGRAWRMCSAPRTSRPSFQPLALRTCAGHAILRVISCRAFPRNNQCLSHSGHALTPTHPLPSSPPHPPPPTYHCYMWLTALIKVHKDKNEIWFSPGRGAWRRGRGEGVLLSSAIFKVAVECLDVEN